LSILESCCLRPMMRNSVLEELRVRRFADIQEEMCFRAVWTEVGNISVGLLLGYQWEDGVSKSQDSKRKKSVFQFIASTGRKL